MWRKSTRSSDTANCVEVLDPWVKSSRSVEANCVEVGFVKASRSGVTNCVEVAACSCHVRVRDSKDPTGPWLKFSRDEWTAFVDGARAGEFDLDPT